MHAFTFDPSRPAPPCDLLGAIVCEEVKAGGRRLFHKGHRLTDPDLAALARVEQPVALVRLAADEVHEDDAARRLAAAMAGPDLGGTLSAKGPAQSRVNLFAATKGLLRVDGAAILAMNRLPGVAVFTMPDRLPVLPGKMVAAAKITPVAIPEATLREAEAIARGAATVRLQPFRPLAVGVVSTEGMSDRLRQRFQETVRRKIGWYGGTVHGFAEVPDDAAAVASAIEAMLGAGADLILSAGGNTMNPLDPALQALPRVGAVLVKAGAPVHPGSMFWLAYRGEAPILNLASCSMYSKATIVDLVLPRVMAGERVTLDDVAGIGVGGMLDRDMAWRFPAYDADAAREDEEE